MPIQPGTDIGRYHILEQLGEGGMAVVYKAYDTRMESEVALKFLRIGDFSVNALPRILKRFQIEARKMAQLQHPNIVKVMDYGEFEGAPYLVMPFLPGGTLKMRLGQPMPFLEAARLLKPIAFALSYAHSKGLIHRDIKPSNILITETGEPMLTDFGIAKILSNEETLDLTTTGMGVGTPEYMAPEQAEGRPIDERADVYSLGIVLYELITGRKPFTADTPLAVIVKQMHDPLPRPSLFIPGLPQEIERLLIKSLAKDPRDRYQNMGELTQAFNQISMEKFEEVVVIPKQKENLLEKSHESKPLAQKPNIQIQRWLPWVIVALLPLIFILLKNDLNSPYIATPFTVFETVVETQIVEKAVEVEKEGEVTIGFSAIELSGVWGQVMNSLVSHAEEKNWDVVTNNANFSAETQANQIEYFISQGVDAIVTVPVDSQAICASVKKAKDAGIPFYIIDRTPIGCEVNMIIQSDNYLAGKQAGETMVELLDSKYGEPKGTILELQGYLGQNVAQMRGDGFNDVLNAYPNITVISKPTEWSADKFSSITLDVVGSTAVDGIYIHSDCVGTTAVLSALEQLGKKFTRDQEGHIFITGVDGCPESLQAIRDGFSDEASSQPVSDFGIIVDWIQKEFDGIAITEGEVVQEGARWSPTQIMKSNIGYILNLSTTTVTKDNVNDPLLWGNN